MIYPYNPYSYYSTMGIPSGYDVYIAIEHDPVEIVYPFKRVRFPVRYVNVRQAG